MKAEAVERQHALGHIECPACEAVKQAMMFGEALGELLFPAAAEVWLRGRKAISESTRQGYADHIAALTAFFGLMKLSEIHIGHLAAYQALRQAEIRLSRRHNARRTESIRLESDGASRINHEMSCLAQVLRQAGRWEPLARYYEPLPLPRKSKAMALEPDEEEHLFQVARSKSRWMVAYCCALLSRNTTAGPSEIRHLRLCDVELGTAAGNFLYIEEGVKNEFRKRPVPLNADAMKAVLWLLERAERLGAREPLHYLLPHRAHHLGALPDPTQPMGSWKKAHYAMCAKAAKKFPRLAQFRLYDYRHTAATDLLENPAISFTTIEHMMGHRLNSNVKRKYDHLRNSALRLAADALNHNYAEPVAAPPRLPPQRDNVRTFARVQSGGFI